MIQNTELLKNKEDVDMFLKIIAKVFGFLSYKRIASGLDTGWLSEIC